MKEDQTILADLARAAEALDQYATLKPFSSYFLVAFICNLHDASMRRDDIFMTLLMRTRASVLVSRVCPQSIYSSRLRPSRRAYATATEQTPDIYDVVCIGGGPAGLTLLTALRTVPQKISHLP